MKKNLLLLAFALFLASAACLAQDEATQKSKAAKYLSDKGYWIIESNVKTPKSSVIYFYTTQDQVVYKETIEGMKIRINKRKVLQRLKNVLEQSVLAYEQNHLFQQDKMIVALALKK